MTEEEIARCFQIESYHLHPELWVKKDGKDFICDSKHAAVWYCQGWNQKIQAQGQIYVPPAGLYHPAALRAWQMGWDDADPESSVLDLPSVL